MFDFVNKVINLNIRLNTLFSILQEYFNCIDESDSSCALPSCIEKDDSFKKQVIQSKNLLIHL